MVIEYSQKWHYENGRIKNELSPAHELAGWEIGISHHKFLVDNMDLINGKLEIQIRDNLDTHRDTIQADIPTELLGKLSMLYHERAERAARAIMASEELIDEIDNN